MKLLALLGNAIFENPLVGRQLATGFTGPRLGAAFTLVALALSITDLIVFLVVFIAEETLGGSITAGEHLHLFNSIVLYAVMTFLLPLRVSGLIDGPRFGRCLDQLVVTGESPLRLHLGSWLQGIYYLFFLLVVSLPFQGMAYLFGGVGLGDIALAYGVLALYANVIIAMTLGLAVLAFEFAAVTGVIAAFLIFGFCSFSPLPPELAEITPVRWLFSSRIDGDFMEMPPGMVAFYTRDPVIFLTALPAPAYRAILWGLLLLTALTFILLGPLHRFQPGLDAFGAVVLPGDRKRSLFRKVRLALTRRVEVAFLYENRPRWCDGWDFALRSLPAILWLALAWGVIIGLVYGGNFVLATYEFQNDWRLGVSISLTAVAGFAWVLFHGDTRERTRWRERIGPFAVPRGILLTAIFALILAGLFAVHYWILERAIESIAAPAAPAQAALAPGQSTLDDYLSHWWRFVPAVMIFLAVAYLLGRVLGRVIPSPFLWRIALVVLGATALFLPVGLFEAFQDGYLPRQGMTVVMISPISLYIPEQFFPMPLADRFAHFLAWQGTFALALSGLLALFWILPRLWRRGVAPAAPRAAAILAAAFLGSAGSLRAQDAREPSPIEVVEVIRSFNGGTFDPGIDFYTVTVRNRGDKDLAGSFYIRAGDEWTTSHRPFELPRGTTKVLRWEEIHLDNPYRFWRLQSGGNLLVLEAGGVKATAPMPAVSVLQSGRSAAADGRHQFILVQEREGPLAQGLSGGNISWLRSSPIALPEDPRAYSNADAVFIGRTDLSSWTEGQRRALYDWVRLGGAAIFFGGLDAASLGGAGVLGEVLRPRSSRRAAVGGRELIVEELDEGESDFWLDGADGGERVPLLSVRAIGPGRVAHLSFDPASFQPPGSRAGADRFWTECLERLPRSVHPALLISTGGDELLRDASSLYGLLAYFGLYTLLLGPGLFFGFRRRSLRRWIPFYIVLLSGAFLAAIPLLNVLLHSRPSFADVHAVDYFGAGDRRGVRIALLRVQSSGRQRHSLELEGMNLEAIALHRRFAHYQYYGPYGDPGWRMLLADLALGEPDSGGREMGLDLLPWSERKVLLLGDVQRPQPWNGKAVLDRRTGSLSFEIEGVPPGEQVIANLLHFNLTGPGSCGTVQLDSSGSLRGKISGTVKLDTRGRNQPQYSPTYIWMAQRRTHSPVALKLDPSSGPHVVLAIGIPASGDDLGIESADLLFEREWSEELSEHRRRRGLSTPTFQREGKTWRSHRYHAILQEIPVELR